MISTSDFLMLLLLLDINKFNELNQLDLGYYVSLFVYLYFLINWYNGFFFFLRNWYNGIVQIIYMHYLFIFEVELLVCLLFLN